VDGGEHEGEAICRGGGGVYRFAELVGLQRQDRGVLDAVGPDPGGGVAEDRSGLLAMAKQSSQDAEGDVTVAAVQRVGGVEDVLVGHFS
jgi:hypothetical protein